MTPALHASVCAQPTASGAWQVRNRGDASSTSRDARPRSPSFGRVLARRGMQTTSERITIPVGGSPMGAYVAHPTEAGKYPGVIVVQEIFGVNPHIRSVTDRVAAEGYVAIAPEIFHRTAPGLEVGYDEAGMARGIPLMMQAKASEVLADVSATIDALKKRPDVGGRGIGIMGFCFGGHREDSPWG